MSHSPLRRRVHLGLRLGPPREPGQGPTVRAVATGSCAEAAGVRPGDELIRIGAHATESIEDARVAQQALDVGALVHLGVRRERELLSLFGRATAFPLEHHPGASLTLDHVELEGQRLRTLELAPDRAGQHPIVYYLPGAHWASEEYSLRPEEPVPALLPFSEADLAASWDQARHAKARNSVKVKTDLNCKQASRGKRISSSPKIGPWCVFFMTP